MKKILKAAVISATLVSTAIFAQETTTAPVATPAPTFSPTQVTAIQKVVHDYLVTNPQVLVEASRTLQEQQQKQMEAAAVGAVAQNKAALFDDAKTPSIGPKTASVTLVEFFDYQCGHCRGMQPTIDQLLAQDKDVRILFKELPIFGGTSAYAAKAALAVAAKQPAKYYAFHNGLLMSTEPLNPEVIAAIAKKAGVNVSEMTKDMNSPAVQNELKANFELAQSLKVMGTPTFVISNKAQTKFGFIPGATDLEDLKAQMAAVK